MKVINLILNLIVVAFIIGNSNCQTNYVLQSGVTVTTIISTIPTRFNISSTSNFYYEVNVFSTNAASVEVFDVNGQIGFNFNSTKKFNLMYLCDQSGFSSFVLLVTSDIESNFTITATQKSRFTSHFIADNVFNDVEYIQLNVTQPCSNISALLYAPNKNFNFFGLLRGCPQTKVRSIRMEDELSNGVDLRQIPVPVQIPSGSDCTGYSDNVNDDYFNKYYLLRDVCVPTGTFNIAVKPNTNDGGPYAYEIKVLNKIVDCPLDCGEHGSCFNGTCYCEDPWYGATCQSFNTSMATKLNLGANNLNFSTGMKFFYLNLTKQDLNGSSLFLDFIGEGLQFSDKLAVYTQSADGSKMLRLFEQFLPYNFVHTICNSAAIGFIYFKAVIRSDSPATATYTISKANQTIQFGSEVEISEMTTSFPAYYRIVGVTDISKIAITIYSNETFRGYFDLVSSRSCGSMFDEWSTKNAIFIKKYNDYDRSNYHLQYKSCFQSADDYYFYLPDSLSYAKLQVFSTDNCKNNCVHGSCLKDNTCYCDQWWGGSTCNVLTGTTQLTPNQAVMVNSENSSKAQGFSYFNANNVPFQIVTNSDVRINLVEGVGVDENQYRVQDRYDMLCPYKSNSNITGNYLIEVGSTRDTENYTVQIVPFNNYIQMNGVGSISVTLSPSSKTKIIEVSFPPNSEALLELVSTDMETFDAIAGDSPCQFSYSGSQSPEVYTFEKENPCIDKGYITVHSASNVAVNVTIKLSIYNTTICPKCCSGVGNCVNNTCQCYPGFTGIDCSKPICVTSAQFSNSLGYQGLQVALTPYAAAELYKENKDSSSCTIEQAFAQVIRGLESEKPYGYPYSICDISSASTELKKHFVPCVNGIIQTPCNNVCDLVTQNCGCSTDYGQYCQTDFDDIRSGFQFLNSSNVFCKTSGLTTGTIGGGVTTGMMSPTVTTSNIQDAESSASMITFQFVLIVAVVSSLLMF